MTKKVIFFSIDRLGDYLIRSNVIKKISKNFDQVQIVSSEKNYKLIFSQSFFSKVFLFDNKNKIKSKLKFIFIFFLKKYEACIVFDGKNISILLLFLIRSDFKFSYVYEKNGFLNLIKKKILLILFFLFNINYEFLYSRKLIEEKKFENYPKKYKNLKKYFSNIEHKTYYIEETNDTSYDYLYNHFILIHLDEKFNDIKNIDTNLFQSLINLRSHVKKKIFLTSYNNNFNYYKKLNFHSVNSDDLKKKDISLPNIIMLKNIPLKNFQNLIKNAYVNISCHSGYFVHTSLALDKKTIDIINKSDEKWLNTWVEKKNNYKKIYKSTINENIDINKILKKLSNEITKQ